MMGYSRWIRSLVALLLALVGTGPLLTLAQEATPVAVEGQTAAADLEVVASGLTNPRGMVWGADGTLFVALAGSGGPNPATEEVPTTEFVGPFAGGLTGAVAQIDAQGCPVLVAGGLPSTLLGQGEVLGAEDVAILGGQLYAAVDGGGPAHGNPDNPSGIYLILANGTTELVADLSAWSRANPVADVPPDFDPDAPGYALVADEAAGLLWVVDPNAGQILSVTPDGVVNRIADLSVGHPVPTRMAPAPDGGVYVATLTAVPFPDGAASVLQVSPDGTVTEVWSGLTAAVDVAIGPEGDLYALEMSTGNLDEPPFLVPGSGRIVRQTGPDQHEVVADGLMFPIAMDVGPDGALYVALPAIGANTGEGVIMRLALEGTGVAATPIAAEVDPPVVCSPLPETTSAPRAPDEVEQGEEAVAEPEEDEPQAPVGATGEVTIASFAFAPQIVEITVGGTVTWTNTDGSSHTATAEDGSWDTGNIDAGASVSLTFETPGTYTYLCAYHPTMTGVVIVT
jgi:plastocyanin